MDNKERIIQATIDLINEKGEQMSGITVREICKRANVGLGLVNYHFGNKDKLIELCVERKTLYLIAVMQQSFLRHKVIMQLYGIDLTVPEEREVFHRTILHDILEV